MIGPVRLAATDLDGTLIRTDGSVSARTRAAMAAAEAAGIVLALVTGRPPRSCRSWAAWSRCPTASPLICAVSAGSCHDSATELSPPRL